MLGDRKQVYIYIYIIIIWKGGLIENNDVVGGYFGQIVFMIYFSDDCFVYGVFKFGFYVFFCFVFCNFFFGLVYSVYIDDVQVLIFLFN